MEEIIYLEPDEEITSVIDKLKKTESDSVGLVIPRNSSLVHSIVNLKLLKKQADELKKEIALVTADKIGKNIAVQVGLPVYEDVHAKKAVSQLGRPELPKGDEVIEVDMSEATADPKTTAGTSSGLKVKRYDNKGGLASSNPSEDEEPASTEESSDLSAETVIEDPEEEGQEMGRHSTAAHTIPTGRPADYRREGRPVNKGLLVFVGIFCLVIAATLLGLPQTSVVVTVAAEPFEKAISLTIDQSAKEVDSSARLIPGRLLSVESDDARRVVATGKKDVGGKAKGQVTVSNSWQTDKYTINAGTVFTSAEGKSFTNPSPIVVPGAVASLNEGKLVTFPGTITATIEATEPGEASNIKPGRFTINGLTEAQRDKIYAESTKDFSGGFTKQVSVMTQSDIDQARDALAEDLAKGSKEKLKVQAKGMKLIDEAVIQDIVNVETNPAKVDSETEYFDIKVKACYRAVVFDEKSVQAVVDEAIRLEVPEGKELLLGEGDEFVVSVLGSDYENGKLELESKIKTKIGDRVDAAEAKKGLAGMSEAAAREQLSDIPNVKDVVVYTFPRWWWQDISYAPWNTRLKILYE